MEVAPKRSRPIMPLRLLLSCWRISTRRVQSSLPCGSRRGQSETKCLGTFGRVSANLRQDFIRVVLTTVMYGRTPAVTYPIWIYQETAGHNGLVLSACSRTAEGAIFHLRV